MSRGISEIWINKAIAALKRDGRLDHVELAEAAGLPARPERGSGRAQQHFVNELKRRKLIVWDGYKSHRYSCGRITQREAYRLAERVGAPATNRSEPS